MISVSGRERESKRQKERERDVIFESPNEEWKGRAGSIIVKGDMGKSWKRTQIGIKMKMTFNIMAKSITRPLLPVVG